VTSPSATKRCARDLGIAEGAGHLNRWFLRMAELDADKIVTEALSYSSVVPIG
jgi:hypothetical protein